MSELVYLASPYSHPNPNVREMRFIAACHAAADLMRQGYRVFSPIAHGHSIAVRSPLPETWDFWREQDFAVLRHCDRLFVLTLSNWIRSVGVRAEIEIMRELGKPVEYVRLVNGRCHKWTRAAVAN